MKAKSHAIHSVAIGVFFCLFMLSIAVPCQAAVSYTFQWDPNHPNDNVVTYRFYWSTASGAYNQTNMDSIPNTAGTIPGTTQTFDPATPEYTKSFPDPAPGELVPAYYFAVTAVDDEGFESDYSLEVDTSSPQVTSTPTPVSLTDTTATIYWTTDKPATSIVEYGTTTGYLHPNSPKTISTYRTSHNVTIDGLAASTTYHFRVSGVSQQGIGPEHLANDSNPSGDVTFTTKAAGGSDTTPPRIVSVPTVVSKTDTSATITWTTDEPSDSVVAYGLTTGYGSIKTNATDVVNHSVTIIGLTPETLYHYQVRSTDAADNGPTSSSDGTFATVATPDSTKPVIVSTPTVTSITDTTAVVEWTTDEPSDSLVEFGKTPYARSKYLGGDVTHHAVTLTLLEDATLYYFRVGSTDEAGNGPAYSSSGTFVTNATPDTSAPIITSTPTVTGVTESTATIVWDTDESSNSQVKYAQFDKTWGSMDYTVSKAEMTTHHVVTLTGLDIADGAADTWYFRVGSTDAAGNGPNKNANATNPNPVDTASALSFSTAKDADNTPPAIISAPTVTSVSGTTATIEWQTDEPSNSQVRYDTAAKTWSTYTQTKNNATMATRHSVTITGLDYDTQYFFRVGSTDIGGNGPDPATLGDNNPTNNELSFTTLQDLAPPQITAPPTVTGITNDSAVIEWSTDEPANSQVRFGTGSAVWTGYPSSKNDGVMVNNHSISISGLAGNTTYFFRVGSTDIEGNGPTVSTEITFKTDPDPDTTPPQFASPPIVTLKTNESATINWTTDEPANSLIQYGTGSALWGAYDTSKSDAAIVTVHSITITGLSGSTTYFFRVGSYDTVGNGPSVSNEVSFTTNQDPDLSPPQIISPPSVTIKTNASATIEWTTNEESNSLVQYGKDSAAWGSYPLNKNDGSMFTRHSITLTNLSGGTAYYFRVGSIDSSGNGPTTSAEVSFTTEPDPDIAPPQITGPPTVTSKTNTSTTITWSTDEPSNSQVQYGEASAAWGAYAASENDAGMVSYHTVTLSGLSGATKYYVRVGSSDAAGNGPTTSNEISFTTLADPDTAAPQFVSPPTVTIKTNDSATIEWTSNEPANSQVHYGTASADWGGYEAIENDADMVTNHSVTLSGLGGSTLYYFRAGSSDAAENGPSVSNQTTFTTLADPDITAPQVTSPPTATIITEKSAVIEWDTNEPSNSAVRYGLETGTWATYRWSEEDSDFTTHHNVTLTGLDRVVVYVEEVVPVYDGDGNVIGEETIQTPTYPCEAGSCTFHVRVGSTDAAGNGPTTSNEVIFTTRPVPDTTPPQFTSPPTVTIKSSETATIVWSTDEPGNSQVQYGEYSMAWDSYPFSESGADMVTTHGVTLTGLRPNTLYYFRAGSTDAAGNEASTTKVFSFLTDPAPDTTSPKIISPPTVTIKTNDSATIEWTTDEPGNSQVAYGTSSATWGTYAFSENDSGMKTVHSVTLTSLDGGTKYYFRVGSTDAIGNGPTTSTEVSFTTQPDPDVTAPEITAPPTVTIKTNETATITWSTDEPGNSQVAYGTASAAWGSYESSENDAGLVTAHNVTLTSLSGSTKYYFRVASTDAAGNGPATSYEVTFTTEPDPDETSPRITIPPTVTDKTYNFATIEWQTDEPSTSQVRFGNDMATWGDYPYVESDSEMVTTHRVTLTGLEAYCPDGGCLFYFMVGSTDASGNGPDPTADDSNNPFTQDTFITQIAPDEKAPNVISGPVVTAVDGFSAIIEWQTDEPSNSSVRYDIFPNVWEGYALSKDDAALVTQHRVTLTGLSSNTQYYYRVGATDAQGNGPELNQDSTNPSAEFTLQTNTVADTSPPVISNVAISWLTNKTALIKWNTDEPSNSQIGYNTVSGSWDNYPFTENDPDMELNHSATLTDLQPSTLYHFRVASTDAKGNSSIQVDELTFITKAGPDLSAPQISNVKIQVLSSSSALVTWTTDEPGNSQVRYGTESREWDAYPYSENDADMVTQHSVTLTGLAPSTLYFVRAGSTDASGNNYTTSIYDANPSIEYNLNSLNADGPSILIYPNPDYPKVNHGSNSIDISFDEANMKKADVPANYAFSPSLSFITTGEPVKLISSTASTSTYRLFFSTLPPYTILSLTVTEEITDTDGYQVEPKTVRINDNDKDELADDWEVSVGLDPTSADASKGQGKDGDFDGDGYSNYEEFINKTDPLNVASYPLPPEYLETIPHAGAGIVDSFRVANNTSFAVLIADSTGIDVTKPDAISFLVDDSVNDPYTVNLNGASDVNLRIIKLVSTDVDAALTRFWVIYDRSLSVYNEFDFSKTVRISVAAVNNNNQYGLVPYRFKVESILAHEVANNTDKLPVFSSIGTEDPHVTGEYDTGLKVDTGDLAGAKIIFNSSDSIIPTFGPTNELPKFNITKSTMIGVAVNLQPPTVFSTPVKLIIPAPGYKNTGKIDVYMYDGENWVLGVNKNGTLYKEGWYVPGSRINGSEYVEIRVYHFTGVQLSEELIVPSDSGSSSGSASEKADAGCFISSVTQGSMGPLAAMMAGLVMAAVLIFWAAHRRRRVK